MIKGKAELRQAAEAFAEVEQLGRFDGPLNLARAYFEEGRIDEAAEAIRRAAKHSTAAPPPWTMAWMSGQINRQLGRLDEAEHDFRKVLEDQTPEMAKTRVRLQPGLRGSQSARADVVRPGQPTPRDRCVEADRESNLARGGAPI